MNKKTLIWAGVVLLAVAATGGAVAMRSAERAAAEAAKKKDAPPLEFTTADVVRVTPRALASELSLPGSVLALNQATVRSKLSAEVRAVHVREGDRVAASQVVVEFDTAQLKVQLAERTAALEQARAQLAQAERTRQANAQLVKQSFISQNAFDTADASYRAQSAAVEAAHAQLEQTRLLLADAVVRAPIAGVIARRHVQPGEKVGFDAPLLALVDLARLEVQAQAPVSDVAQIARGARVAVEIEGLPGRSFSGRVDRINPSTEPGTRTINLYVGLANDDALLKVGMFARVRLQVGAEREVPALPLSAVRSDNGVDTVWVLADGRLARRPVQLGRRDERAQLVEVIGGLTPADIVIATRFDNLRDGLAARLISAAGDAAVAGRDLPRADARAN